jgi:hypothetical protein
VSRSSRFSKLEGDRPSEDDKPATGASLERFAAEPELGARVDPVDRLAPEHGAERLQRFEAGGNEGLGLDRDPLAKLPMLECPRCKTQCGKFETTCHGCQTSLTTAEARDHNLRRLESLKAEQAVSLEAERDKREQELIDAELGRMQVRAAEHGMAQDLRDTFSLETRKSAGRKWWAATWIALATGLLVHSTGLKVAMFGLFAVLLMSRLPRSVWTYLGQKARPREPY